MRIVIAGGTGLIGSALTRSLLADGHQVVVLTRDAAGARTRLPAGAEAVAWDLQPGGAWESVLDGADAVVNLAGESIGSGLWTAARKQRIRGSRVDATRALAAALARPNRPRVLVNGSAVGYYGDRGDEALPETASPGADFLASVVQEWEGAARAAAAHGVRVVLVRSGIVLAPQAGTGPPIALPVKFLRGEPIAGGVLAMLALPYRFFLGGTMGRPNQWVPWIHLDDEVGLIRLALDTPALSGPLNAVAPEAVTMGAFCRTIGRILGRPTWLPGAAIGMKLALRDQAVVVLASLKVMPAVAERFNYQFVYPTHEAALRAALLTPERPAVRVA